MQFGLQFRFKIDLLLESKIDTFAHLFRFSTIGVINPIAHTVFTYSKGQMKILHI